MEEIDLAFEAKLHDLGLAQANERRDGLDAGLRAREARKCIEKHLAGSDATRGGGSSPVSPIASRAIPFCAA